MTCDDNKFKHITHWGDTQIMNRLELNLKAWFDSALLCTGAWTNVTPPTPGAFGGDFAKLRRVDDPSYTAGTVYEGVRLDWVWESAVDYVDTTATTQNPQSPATVFVNAVPTAPDFINYPLGRVHFAAPLVATDVVTATYSYRIVQTYIANNARWWKELQYRSFRPDDSQFQQLSAGFWVVNGQHRVQMPAVVLECVPMTRTGRPAQIGDGSYWREQDVLVHVLAESRYERNKLVDIFVDQFDKNIWLFDNDAAVLAGDFPLDHRGEIVDSTQDYDALVDGTNGHRWERCRFIRTRSSEVETINSRLYEGVVRMTCEVFMHD